MSIFKNRIATIILIAFAFSARAIYAQESVADSLQAEAIRKGISPVDIPGYIHLHSAGKHDHIQTVMREPENMAPVSLSNPGFETADFTGWICAIGDNNLSSNGPLQNVQYGVYTGATDPPLGLMTARHSIMTSASGNDSLAGFPIVPPGYGYYVARLGNTYGGFYGEFIEQYFTVNPSTPYIRFGYAVVLNDAAGSEHIPGDGSYFTYLLTDSAGTDTIAYTMDIMYNHPPGYMLDTVTNLYYYLPWRNDSIDLSAYINQPVHIRFQVAGCIYGGHSGYFYLDVTDPLNLAGIPDDATASFSVYPNPSDGIFNLRLNTPNSGTVLVRDIAGRTIHKDVFSNSGILQLDLSSQKAGIYFVTVQDQSGISTQRILVQ